MVQDFVSFYNPHRDGEALAVDSAFPRNSIFVKPLRDEQFCTVQDMQLHPRVREGLINVRLTLNELLRRVRGRVEHLFNFGAGLGRWARTRSWHRDNLSAFHTLRFLCAIHKVELKGTARGTAYPPYIEEIQAAVEVHRVQSWRYGTVEEIQLRLGRRQHARQGPNQQ
jgi:hypothetical protein